MTADIEFLVILTKTILQLIALFGSAIVIVLIIMILVWLSGVRS
jgi:hypothetical protein